MALRFRSPRRVSALCGAAAALLLVACAGPSAEELASRRGGSPEPTSSNPSSAPSAASDTPDSAFGGPGSHALQLLGGQTGSDATPESADPCRSATQTAYALAAPTPLGFSAADALSALQATPADILLRWSVAEPVAAQLSFSADGGATLFDRDTTSGECSDVLQLQVTITLTSDRAGISGSWVTDLYAESAVSSAGFGSAAAGALGSELFERAGNPEGLRLTYELSDGAVHGWITAPEEPSRVLAAF